MARALFERGVGLGKSGDYEAGVEEVERAHSIVANPKLLVTIAELAHAAKDWARAVTSARLALGCETEIGDASERMAES